MAKIAITGGKGFIGSHLIDALLSKNHTVTTFDASKREVHYPGWQKVKFIQGNILDPKSFNKLIADNDYTFHLAGLLGTSETIENIKDTVDSNILGTIIFLEALKNNKKDGQTITIGSINWLNPYAITKLASERFSLMYAKEFDVNVKVIRGLNTYGSRQKHSPVRKAVPNFIINALRNEPIVIFGDGNQILDLVYVKDLVEVMIRAMEFKGEISHVIDAGTGVKTTVNELAETIIKLTNSKSKVVYAKMRQGEPEHSVTVGNTDTLKELSYIPKTTLKEGLLKTIAWYSEKLATSQFF